MRTATATLLAAQKAATRQPYLKMVFTSLDGETTYDFSSDSVAFGNRLFLLDFYEESYNGNGRNVHSYIHRAIKGLEYA